MDSQDSREPPSTQPAVKPWNPRAAGSAERRWRRLASPASGTHPWGAPSPARRPGGEGPQPAGVARDKQAASGGPRSPGPAQRGRRGAAGDAAPLPRREGPGLRERKRSPAGPETGETLTDTRAAAGPPAYAHRAKDVYLHSGGRISAGLRRAGDPEKVGQGALPPGERNRLGACDPGARGEPAARTRTLAPSFPCPRVKSRGRRLRLSQVIVEVH